MTLPGNTQAGGWLEEGRSTGDLESISRWAGQSCSLVRDIKPAGQIVRDIIREAAEVIDRLSRIRTEPQPV